MFFMCLIPLILFGLFKQYRVLLPILNHSSWVWEVMWSIQPVHDLLQPVHDWFDLYSIHSSSISLTHPVFDHFSLYSICLTCRGCIPSIQHVFGWCDRYWSHKSRNWAAFAICQVYRYHSMTVTISSHAFNSFDLYLTFLAEDFGRFCWPKYVRVCHNFRPANMIHFAWYNQLSCNFLIDTFHQSNPL